MRQSKKEPIQKLAKRLLKIPKETSRQVKDQDSIIQRADELFHRCDTYGNSHTETTTQ